MLQQLASVNTALEGKLWAQVLDSRTFTQEADHASAGANMISMTSAVLHGDDDTSADASSNCKARKTIQMTNESSQLDPHGT